MATRYTDNVGGSSSNDGLTALTPKAHPTQHVVTNGDLIYLKGTNVPYDFTGAIGWDLSARTSIAVRQWPGYDKPILTHTDAAATRCLNLGGGVNDVTGLVIQDTVGGGIRSNGVAGASITVQSCELYRIGPSQNFVDIGGGVSIGTVTPIATLRVLDTIIDGCGRTNIFIKATDLVEVARCRLSNCGVADPAGNTGDNIQLVDACSLFWVHENYIEHLKDAKQCAIQSGTATGYTLFERNECYGPEGTVIYHKALYSDQPATMRRNKIRTGGWAMQLKAGSLAEANIVLINGSGHGVNQAPLFAEGAGTVIKNNTVILLSGGANFYSAIQKSDAASGSVQNNIIVGAWNRGIRRHSTQVTETNNDVHGATLFAADESLNTLSPGAGSKQVDPQFDTNYEPANEDLWEAGAVGAASSDFHGRPFRATPTIGAVEHYSKAGAPSGLPSIGLLLGTWSAIFEERPTTVEAFSGAVPHSVEFGGDYLNLGSTFDEDTIPTPSEVAESITTSDSVSGPVAYGGTYAESATVSDAFAGLPAYPVAYSDSASVAEAFELLALGSSGGAAPLPSIGLLLELHLVLAEFAESATPSDSQSAVMVAPGAFADSATVADALAGALGPAAASYADSATVSDALTGGIESPNAAFADSITVSDAQDSVYALPVGFADSATLSDAVDGDLAAPSVYADSATAADAFSLVVTELGLYSDAVTASEAMSAAMVTARSFADTITAGFDSDLVDIFVSDSYAATFSIGAAVSESATVSDAFDGITGALVEESIAVDDAQSVAIDYVPAYAESATPAQSLTGAVVTSVEFSDSVSLSDLTSSPASASASFSDEITLTELTDGAYTQPSDFAETATLDDALDAIRAHAAAFGAPVTVADAMLGGFDVGALLSEPATAVEAFNASIAQPGSFDEPVTASQLLTARWIGTLLQEELATAGEGFEGTYGEATGVLEPTLVFDQYGTTVGYAVAVAESVALADDFGCTVETHALINETTTAEFTSLPGFAVYSIFAEAATLSDLMRFRDLSHGYIITVDGTDRIINVDGTDRTITVEDKP